MKTTLALKTGATYGGPAVFGAGAAMLAAVLAASAPSHPQAAGPARSPTAVSAPETRRPTAHHTPRASVPSSAPPGRRPILAAGERVYATGGTGDTSTGGSTPPVRPAPSPQPPARDGVRASVRLPLGVLPSVGVDLTIGGKSR